MPSRAYLTETKSVPTKKAARSSEASASAAFPFVPSCVRNPGGGIRLQVSGYSKRKTRMPVTLTRHRFTLSEALL